METKKDTIIFQFRIKEGENIDLSNRIDSCTNNGVFDRFDIIALKTFDSVIPETSAGAILIRDEDLSDLYFCFDNCKDCIYSSDENESYKKIDEYLDEKGIVENRFLAKEILRRQLVEKPIIFSGRRRGYKELAKSTAERVSKEYNIYMIQYEVKQNGS